MSRPTLYLHIGQTKTATTSLQAFCHANRRWLLERGLLYPEVPPAHEVRTKHHHLVDSLRANPERDAAPWQALAGLADAAGARALLLSDEVFWHLHAPRPERRPAALAWIARQLAGFDVRVVCYLRRQDHWVESWFNQQAKGGRARTAELGFDHFVARCQQTGLLAYDEILADWARAFGEERLLVRSFERDQLQRGDLLDDFLQQLGLDISDGAQRPGDRQLALDRPASLLMNAVNRANASEELRERLRLALRSAEGEPADPRRLLSPARAAALLEAAQAGNAEVARRYRGGRPLFDDLRLHDDAQHYTALTAPDRDALRARLAAAGIAVGEMPPAAGALVQAVAEPPAASVATPAGAVDEPVPPCERVYIYTVPKAGTYLMSEFIGRLGLASSGWHISQSKVLHTLALDAETNRAEPSRATVRASYLNSFRQLAARQHAFGHFSPLYVPPGLLAEKDYRIVAVKRHPREVLVSEFIDFRHRRRDVEWVGEQRIPDHHEAFATYLREHGPVIRHICVSFLALQAMAAQADYQELLGPRPRYLFIAFQDFVGRETGAATACRIADFLGFGGTPAQVAQLHALALAADNKTKSVDLALPYERASLWTPQAEEAYQRLGFDELADRLGG